MFNRLKMNLWILVFEFINLVENYIMKYLLVFLLVGISVNYFGQSKKIILKTGDTLSLEYNDQFEGEIWMSWGAYGMDNEKGMQFSNDRVACFTDALKNLMNSSNYIDIQINKPSPSCEFIFIRSYIDSPKNSDVKYHLGALLDNLRNYSLVSCSVTLNEVQEIYNWFNSLPIVTAGYCTGTVNY